MKDDTLLKEAQELNLAEISGREFGLCERKGGLLHDLAHRLLRLNDLLQDHPEPELQGIGLLLQQRVALLGCLEPALHGRHGASAGEDGDAVLA